MLKHLVLAGFLGVTPALADGIGNIGGYDANKPVTLGAAASSHSASQALGGWQKINLFRGTAQPSGILATVSLGSQSGLTGAVTLYMLRAAPTAGSTCLDGQAFVLAQADFLNFAIAPQVLTPVALQGVTQTFVQQSPAWASPVGNNDSSPTTYAYVCVVANGTIVPATTTDLWIMLSLAQD